MARTYYDRLSFQDNTFLAFETSSAHLHVSGIATFKSGGLRNADGGIDIDRVRDYVASRLHLIPRYRQIIRYIPFEQHPVWVDDRHFNLEYHVRHTCLPKPGDESQLKGMAARIMAQKLDRSKPLWEMWVVEGLDGGDRFSLITKVHHCMIDGMSGVELMRVLLSPDPDEPLSPVVAWQPRRQPSDLDLVRDAALRWVGGPMWLARNAGEVVRAALDDESELRTRLRAVGEAVGSGAGGVADTPLSGQIGPHRRFEWTTMSVAEMRRIKKQLGGSLNDLVLTIVSGALVRYFARHQVTLDGQDFVVAAPVSVRSEEEHGSLGNRVSTWLIPLPLEEPDPLLRIRQIGTVTADLKRKHSALGAETIMSLGEWTPSTFLSLGARVIPRMLPMNMIVTNVPGPQLPLYMLGARLCENYGQVPLMEGTGLGIALFSYDGLLCWGFNADWDRVPDLSDFVNDIKDAFEELVALAPVAADAESA
ncbi:MAG: diacylglycerol O-acyltransferase [Hyphomicrobiaceae bacterium]|jgi:diacylglycerol O-acyltransferase